MKKNFFSPKHQNAHYLYGSLFLILTLLWTVFIFSRSLNNASESTAESNKVIEIVEKTAETVGIEIEDTDSLSAIVRKSAHFIEFGALGALSFLTLKFFKLKKRVLIFISVGYCLVIACADEYIQTFSSGRSSQVSDILIDITGSLFTICMLLFISFLIKKRKINNRYQS
ncbi:MAG: hypothetical protein A2Y15_01255 [Clostridiales bacterium GWF2_36_10]|nr:MAG: hypothetical protein A2Y15_01255 [Clostridiales bacterium GWF2_36_10]